MLDVPTHEELVRRLTEDGTVADYERLFREVFVLACRRLFGTSNHRSAVVRFVADARKTVTSDLDITAAENLLLLALDDPSVDRNPTAEQLALVGPLCIELVHRLELTDEQLSDLVATARNSVEQRPHAPR